MPNTYKLVILDLDHTVRRPLDGKTFSNGPKDQEPINQHLYKTYEGSTFVGLTNQGGVISGYRTLNSVAEECKETLRQQPLLDRICFCPDWGDTLWHITKEGLTYSTPAKNVGGYRKPQPEGINDLMFIYEVKPEETIMFGDRSVDEMAAFRANITFNYV